MFALKSEHRLDDLLEAAGLARSTYFYHQKRLLDPTQREKHAVLKQAIVGLPANRGHVVELPSG